MLPFVLWNYLTSQGSKSWSEIQTCTHMQWQILICRVHCNQYTVHSLPYMYQYRYNISMKSIYVDSLLCMYVCQLCFPVRDCMHAFAGFVGMDYNRMSLEEHALLVAWSSDMLAHNHKLLMRPWIWCLTPKPLQFGFPEDIRGPCGLKQRCFLLWTATINYILPLNEMVFWWRTLSVLQVINIFKLCH